MKFFDMHKHETIMMTRFLMILCRAPRHPPGKEDVVKSVGIIFLLVLWLSPTGGEATYVVKMSEWVSEWVSDGYNRIPILIQFLLDIHCTTHSLFWSTIEDEKHLTIISRWRVKKTKVFPISHKVIGATWKPTGKRFSLNGEYLTVWISELCSVDQNIPFFSVLAVTLQKMINTSK